MSTTPIDATPDDEATEAKHHLAGVFDRAADTYEDVGVDFFTLWGRRLVEIAEIGPGDRVLDVGCGSGAVLLPAAEAVGPTGSVLGIDLADGMVRRCEQLIALDGWTHVEVRLGDAEHPGVEDGAVDAVLGGLVIFFLPDPDGALDEYHRALVPGGTLALSTFGPEDESFRSVFAAAAAHLPPPDEPAGEDGPPRPRVDQGPFATADGIAAILGRHGFADVRHVDEVREVEFANDEAWIRWSWSHGARALWESIPEDRRPAAHTDALTALAALHPTGEPLRQRWALRYTVARRG